MTQTPRAGSSVVARVTKYMWDNTPNNPFAVRAAIWALRDIHAVEGESKATQKLGRTTAALSGVCSLHIDQLWNSYLRDARWWRRSKLARTEKAWKGAKFSEMYDRAESDVQGMLV